MFVGCWLGVGRVRWDVNGFWIVVLVGFEGRVGGGFGVVVVVTSAA